MKILFITLSNIGDCLLTLPALDILRQNIHHPRIAVICSPRAEGIFANNPHIENVITYDKRAGVKEQIKLYQHLKKAKFDVIVDLRNTFMSAILPARYKTSPFLNIPKDIVHMKDRHIFKVKALLSRMRIKIIHDRQETTLFTPPADKKYIKDILIAHNISFSDKIVIVSAGARSHIKKWPQERFVELFNVLAKESGVKIILVGDKDDVGVSAHIAASCKYPILDLTGKTTLLQLARLLSSASIVIANDSAVMHLASYLNIPVVAVFGPTNEAKYGPWSDNLGIAKKDIFCRPCEEAQCRFGTLECMQFIKVEDVLRQVRDVFQGRRMKDEVRKNNFKRILIVRTDRIGDVLLSTPVIKALRDAHPQGYIAMMVASYAKDIIDGNPYLDRVIVYDKSGEHKGLQGTFRLAHNLGEDKFDIAIVLHPTNRVHIVTFLAGIPIRIGYNRKLGFLLTHRITHAKQLGEKHEAEYNFDLLKYLGVELKGEDLYMPIKAESEEWTDILFREKGIRGSDTLLAIHPGASCPSKIWPNNRFAQVADKLIDKYGFKVLLVAGAGDEPFASGVIKHMHHSAINLAGRTSISQLASVLKRCRLFISNDSGPVHIASAVKTPVISIFGRNQRGLSPKRWGPRGKQDKFLHKQVGCIECLAHNCKKEFSCLRAISVEDVVAAADSILKFKLI